MDSTDIINETTNFVEIYRKNRFKVGDIDFSFEELPKLDFFVRPFAILTAWYPNNNESTSIHINAKNNKLLENELKDLKLYFVDAIGYLDQHSEESGALEVLCQSDRILNSKGLTHEHTVRSQ